MTFSEAIALGALAGLILIMLFIIAMAGGDGE